MRPAGFPDLGSPRSRITRGTTDLPAGPGPPADTPTSGAVAATATLRRRRMPARTEPPPRGGRRGDLAARARGVVAASTDSPAGRPREPRGQVPRREGGAGRTLPRRARPLGRRRRRPKLRAHALRTRPSPARRPGSRSCPGAGGGRRRRRGAAAPGRAGARDDRCTRDRAVDRMAGARVGRLGGRAGDGACTAAWSHQLTTPSTARSRRSCPRGRGAPRTRECSRWSPQPRSRRRLCLVSLAHRARLGPYCSRDCTVDAFVVRETSPSSRSG